MFVNPTNHPIFIPIAINRRGAFKYNPPLPSFLSSPPIYPIYFIEIIDRKKIVSSDVSTDASKNFPTKSKCTVFLKRNSLPFLLPLSFPKSFQKKRADNPIIRPREESCSGRISFELDLAERKKKKGGKNLKFLFRFPEKRTVYEKGGQG